MMVKEGKEGRNKYFYHFCRFLHEKEVGEHKDSVASQKKTGTEKVKTGLLLGILDGKAYICSESLSGKIIL